MTKFLTFLLIISSIRMVSQDVIEFKNEKINEINADNQKVGTWKIYDNSGNLRAVGLVADSSKFAVVHYYVDGKIVATQSADSNFVFVDNAQTVKAILNFKDREHPLKTLDGQPVSDKIFKRYTQFSELPTMNYGGNEAISKYLSRKMRKMPRRGDRIVVQITIDIDGRVDLVNVLSGGSEIVNRELVKTLKNMPRWQPGVQAGHFIRSQFTIPLNF
ncbi:MAG: TonB family protein [Flavobacterium sp.]|nr:TonB family protein [Flavobacterium sp.]